MQIRSLEDLLALDSGVHTIIPLIRLREQREDFPAVCGIYFLWDEDALVYVGQSVDVGCIVYDHMRTQRERQNKKWDFANWLLCDPDELDYFEASYIYTYLPRYNNGLSLVALRNEKRRYTKAA